MNKDAFLFFALTFLCVALQAFFSSFEMAALSFNKMRLEYLAQKKKKKAELLLFLLKKPSRLFASTLVMVTTFLELGSESARRFYESLGFNPDMAPLTQVILVVVLGELAPLFAARRHSEQVALFSVGIVHKVTKLLAPLIFVLDKISYYLNRAFKKEASGLFLTKEELQKAFEEKEKAFPSSRVSRHISTIFNLKNLTVKKVAFPLESAKMVDSKMTLFQLKKEYQDSEGYFLIYHDKKSNVVGIATLTELMKLHLSERVVSASRSPWFVTENTTLLSLIKEFRFNRQKVAVILNKSGQATGFMPLELIMDLIFEKRLPRKRAKKQIEMTLSGKMAIYKFNLRFKADLPFEHKKDTLSDMINKQLGHHPSEGDSIQISGYEFMVRKPALLGSKRITVRSKV